MLGGASRTVAKKDKARRDIEKLIKGRTSWGIIIDPEDERALRAAMRHMRRRLRKGPGGSFGKDSSALNRDRFARRKARELLKSVKIGPQYRLDRIDKDRLVSRFVPSDILRALHPTRREEWIAIPKRPRRISYPSLGLKDFSCLDHPDAVLQGLKAISLLDCQEISSLLNFEDGHVDDIGSFLVLSEVWPAIRSLCIGGKMPLPVQRVLFEMGMGKELRIRLGGAKNARNQGEVWTMPVQRRRPLNRAQSQGTLIEPQASDIAATRFGELVNRWLGIDAIEAELTPNGLGQLKGIFGELLDNAVRHSIPGSRDGNWSMAAFMARRKIEGAAEPQFVCRIAVLSPGQSIADTFQRAAPRIAEYANLYARGHANACQSEDTLKTLLAIQDMITTDVDAYELGDGGTGMMAIIHFFNALASLENPAIAPKITIVSGSSCVRLRAPYIAGQTDPNWSKDGAPPRQLWCNERNTRQEPPDPNFVFDLQERLAGTLITMGFTLNAEWIKSALSDDNGESVG